MGNSTERLLQDIRNGNSAASEEVFSRFADRLRRFAHSRLDRRLNGKVSANDIVQSVFRSFFRRNQAGEFTFENWNGIWALLATIAARKCHRSHQKFSYAKHDVQREVSLSAGVLPPTEVFSNEPTPDELVALQDTIEWSLLGLTEFQQQVVLLRLADFSAAEIGELVDRTERTVRRILEKFRDRLESQM